MEIGSVTKLTSPFPFVVYVETSARAQRYRGLMITAKTQTQFPTYLFKMIASEKS